jgi:hypothetical protein
MADLMLAPNPMAGDLTVVAANPMAEDLTVVANPMAEGTANG